MNLLDAIVDAQGGDTVSLLGSHFGLQGSQTKSALGKGNHSRYLDDSSTLTDPDTVKDGNGILGHLLGSKDVSRRVARQASQKTGLGEGILKKMLPLVASMAMSAYE